MGSVCLSAYGLGAFCKQSSYAARSPNHSTDLVAFEAPTKALDRGQENSAYDSGFGPLQTIGGAVDIGPPVNVMWRQKRGCVQGLETVSKDGGNEILSVKTVQSERLLVDGNHL